MEPKDDARRDVAVEIRKLAEEFERDDEAAFRRNRIVCWVVMVVVTALILVILGLGGDARFLAVLWVVIVGLIWAGYVHSSRRQRQQTGRLRELASRWLGSSNGGERASLGAAPDL